MTSSIDNIIAAVTSSSWEDLAANLSKEDPNSTQVGGSHYAASYQHWDFMSDLQPSWPEGCMSKYLCRSFKKNGLQDIEKVLHYCYKLMSLQQTGKADIPRGLTVAQRADLYVRFYQAQDLQAPNEDLRRLVRDCFRHLSTWETFRDLYILFDCVVALHTAVKEYDPPNRVSTPDPVMSEPSVGSEPDRNYVQQDATPTPPPVSPNQARAQAMTSWVEHLRSLRGSIDVLAASRLIYPLSVHSSRVEALRRSKESTLNLNIDGAFPAWCSDYSEACLKIDLASSALDEALPNRQTERALAALAALVDGTFSLVAWFLPRVGVLSADGGVSNSLLSTVDLLLNHTHHHASKILSKEEINAYLGHEVWGA